MSPILGIIASQNYQRITDTGDMFPISAITVGSAGAASITFSSIPSTYTHLQIRGIARCNNSFNNQFNRVQFNSDTTAANYAWHALDGDGSSATAFAGTSTAGTTAFTITGGTSTANMFGVFVIDILDFANSNKYKTVRSLSGHDQNGNGIIRFSSGLWLSTNAITSIEIKPNDSSYAQYSSFALYGIKGA